MWIAPTLWCRMKNSAHPANESIACRPGNNLTIAEERDWWREEAERLRQLVSNSSDIKSDLLFKLTPSHKRLLLILLHKTAATTDDCLSALYWDADSEPESGFKIIHVLMSQMRKTLRPYNVSIHHTRSCGYYIKPDEKKRLRK